MVAAGRTTYAADPEQGALIVRPIERLEIAILVVVVLLLAIADPADYIDTFYNQTRRHSHFGGMSPDQFEAAHKPTRRGVH
jgi:hypothetical protein